MTRFTRPWRQLLSDLAQAVSVWKTNPWLPLASMTLVVLASVPPLLLRTGAVSGIGLGLAVASIVPCVIAVAGWVGTERLIYLVAWNSGRLRPAELWAATQAYARRYIALGIISFAPAVVLIEMANAAWGAESAFAMAVTIVSFILVDIALTFVSPALAYSTESAWEALRMGLKALVDTWPSGALHVLIPPLVLTLLAHLSSGIYFGLIWSGAWALVGLLVKGGIARFYLQWSRDLAGLPIRNTSRVAGEMAAGTLRLPTDIVESP